MTTLLVNPVPPAPPVIDDATVYTIASQRRLAGAGSGVFTNRRSTVKMPYVCKDGADIPLLDFSDHDLTNCAGLIRVQNGHVGLLSAKRIAIPNGKYASGVGCGMVLVSGAHLDEILMEDIDYARAEPITASGDIYAGLLTGGGHNADGSAYGSCNKWTIRRARARNMFTNYAAGDTSYKNTDGIAVETTFPNGLVDNCELRFGADAGFDCKGANCRVQATIVEGFRENFKTWIYRVDGDVCSISPTFAHWLITKMGASAPPTEHVTEFAHIISTDPTKEIVKFERGPGIKRFLNTVLEVPDGQVLAKADQDAFGSQIIFGDKVIEINQPIVML